MTFYEININKWFSGITIYLCVLLLSINYGNAANQSRFYFNHLNSTNSNLSYNCIHSIIQDSRGFIWFGTSNGLNRYDGVNLRIYTKEDLGISSSFVISICEDDSGCIWIGTDRGVSIYDPNYDRFTSFNLESDQKTIIRNKVTKIKKDKQGVLWMAVNNQGLFAYDPESKRLKNYFVVDGKQTLPSNIVSFCFDNNNTCWLSLYFSNLYQADENLENLIPIEITNNDFFKDDNIVEILESPYNTIYIASVNKGVCEIDLRRNKVKTLVPNNEKGFIPISMLFDKSRKLWIATNEGAYIYDTSSGNTQYLEANKNDKFSLSDNYVLSICIDNLNGIWLGTNAGGINYSGLFQKNFEKYYTYQNTPLEDGFVRGFASDEEGNIWITTEKAGLFVFSPQDKELIKYRNPNLPKSLFGICYEDGNLWLGSPLGLCKLNIKSNSLNIYSQVGYGLNLRDSKIFIIYKTSEGDILVGTTLGLIIYDKQTDSFVPEKELEGLFITDIIEDSRGDLWIATYADGLLKYDYQNKEIIAQYKNNPNDSDSLPINKILSVFEDSIGRIWATTFGAGFFLYDEENDNFIVCDKLLTNEKASNINYALMDDSDGNIWVSSSKGLIYFSPDLHEARIFTTLDGLLNNEFNYNARFKSDDGTLYFGSTDGFICFNPQYFYTDSAVPDILITDFYIGDERVVAGAENSPLTRSIDKTRQIRLSAKQNSFKFGFSLLRSASPASNTILCKLDGYDTDWRKVSYDNTLFYSNIPAGYYKLYVKGANSNGLWNETHPPLEIYVAQKFYKSTLAIFLYILFFIIVVVLSWFYFYRRAVKYEQHRQEEYKRVKELELFNEKMKFFSNIIHELKTPLTLIRIPLQNILNNGDYNNEMKEDLMVINNNTEHISLLIKELRDFVKVIGDGYVLNRHDIDIVEKLGFLCFNFSEMAKNNNIKLTLKHTDEQLYIYADEPGLNKILNNLLHNAIKYAYSYIEIEVTHVDEQVVVTFENDGPRIPMEQREDIFKPFVQYSNDSQPFIGGVGIGLSLARSLAELHSGSLELDDAPHCTRFILTLNLKSENEKAEAIENNSILGDQEIIGKENTQLPLLLIVENNLEFSNYLIQKLLNEYRILTVTTAEEALELLKQHEIDLVITDSDLQGMDGLELCRTISSNIEISHISIVILSSHSSAKSQIVGMESGASVYIEKPFSIDYLKVCLNNILWRRNKLKQLYKSKFMYPLTTQMFDLTHTDEKFLSQLDEFIYSNISDPLLSNDEIANALYMSKSTLTRKIKALLDTTPNDYIRNKRLVLAAQMLSESTCRVNDVCYSVGFNTPSYFAKCFKKVYGVLPMEYMNLKNNTNE